MTFKRKIYSRLLDWKFNLNGGKTLLVEGANLLGKEDIYDNLIRLRNKESVAELLEIAFYQQDSN